MSYSSRVYRQRNPRSQEKADQEGFFSKKHDMEQDAKSDSFFQAKLAINKPGDKFEQEADAVANSVVNQSAKGAAVKQKDIGTVQRVTSPDKEKERKPGKSNEPKKEEEKVQRKDAREEEEKATPAKVEANSPAAPATEEKKKKSIQKKEEPKKEDEEKNGAVQTKRDSSAAEEPAGLAAQLKDRSGKGQQLSPDVLQEMNTSFGADFSGVRVHKDDDAAGMSDTIRAEAFTHGSDIYFNKGKYDPRSSPGKKLLAHELTHTLQQGGKTSLPKTPSPVQRQAEERNLQSGRFAGDERLEEALDGNRHVKFGDEGDHVKKLQQAMIDDGIQMPISTRKTGLPDGIFLSETQEAVRTFQRHCGLAAKDVDGIVGPITMGLFDARYAGAPGVTKPATPKKVTINFTVLYGNTLDPSRMLAYANTIFKNQANIEIVKGKEVKFDREKTEALIGKDLRLKMHLFDHFASDEEKQLFTKNQSEGSISAYFVKEIADDDGSISQEAVAYALTAGSKMGIIGFAMGSRSEFNTFAHELGHVMGVEKHSEDGAKFLMDAGAPGFSLSAKTIETLRSSTFAKDV